MIARNGDTLGDDLWRKNNESWNGSRISRRAALALRDRRVNIRRRTALTLEVKCKWLNFANIIF